MTFENQACPHCYGDGHRCWTCGEPEQCCECDDPNQGECDTCEGTGRAAPEEPKP